METNHFSKSWKNTMSTSCSSHKNISNHASPGTERSIWPLWTWPISMLPSHQKIGMNVPKWLRSNLGLLPNMQVRISQSLEACSKLREVPQLSSLERKLVYLRIRLKKNKSAQNSPVLSSLRWQLRISRMPTMAHHRNRLERHKKMILLNKGLENIRCLS